MAQQELARSTQERRCPNCGTRVAVEAESCFMCGFDLRSPQRRRRRISLIDTLLVLAVLGVLAFWWQMGSSEPADANATNAEGVLPGDIPQLEPTAILTPTLEATAIAVPTPQLQTQVVQRVHEVKSGDTLSAIATLYRVTVEEIQANNGLKDVKILPGQRLTIPVTIQVAVSGAGAPVQYTVKTGDTIFSIAASLGTSPEAILAANGLAQSDIIKPGDLLQIPASSVPPEVLSSLQQPAGDQPPPAEPAAQLYAAPRPLAPPDNGEVSRAEIVILQWVSVDILLPNEWYVVQIYPKEGSAKTIPTLWTKSTSHRMSLDLAPAEGETATYSWQISVIRVKVGENGQRLLEPVSPASEIRRFTWK